MYLQVLQVFAFLWKECNRSNLTCICRFYRCLRSCGRNAIDLTSPVPADSTGVCVLVEGMQYILSHLYLQVLQVFAFLWKECNISYLTCIFRFYRCLRSCGRNAIDLTSPVSAGSTGVCVLVEGMQYILSHLYLQVLQVFAFLWKECNRSNLTCICRFYRCLRSCGRNAIYLISPVSAGSAGVCVLVEGMQYILSHLYLQVLQVFAFLWKECNISYLTCICRFCRCLRSCGRNAIYLISPVSAGSAGVCVHVEGMQYILSHLYLQVLQVFAFLKKECNRYNLNCICRFYRCLCELTTGNANVHAMHIDDDPGVKMKC